MAKEGTVNNWCVVLYYMCLTVVMKIVTAVFIMSRDGNVSDTRKNGVSVVVVVKTSQSKPADKLINGKW